MIAQLNTQYISTRPSKAISRLISYFFFEGRPATTKGRWINPLVLSFLRRIATSKRKFRPVKKPIFIIGTGRSGTTILGIILSMHKDVGYLNEPKGLWHIIHPQEDIIGSYSDQDGFYRITSEDVSDEMCQRAKQLFGAYLSTTRAHRIVDKYPELIFRVDFVQTLFPDAKFIFLIRNGWDTCQSIAAWSKRLGIQVKGETHDWWGVDDRKWRLLVEQLVATDDDMKEIVSEIRNLDQHLDRAAVEWVVTMREGLNQEQLFPDCTHRVYFEELTLQPHKTLSSLCDFCELSIDSTFIEYAKKTLHPVPSREQFDIHHKIAPIFNDTMDRLGYNS